MPSEPWQCSLCADIASGSVYPRREYRREELCDECRDALEEEANHAE